MNDFVFGSYNILRIDFEKNKIPKSAIKSFYFQKLKKFKKAIKYTKYVTPTIRKNVLFRKIAQTS